VGFFKAIFALIWTKNDSAVDAMRGFSNLRRAAVDSLRVLFVRFSRARYLSNGDDDEPTTATNIRPIMNIREMVLSDMPTLSHFFIHPRYTPFAQQQLYIWSSSKSSFIRVCGVTLFPGSTFLYLGDNPR